MSDSVRPPRRQPTRLPRPWDSPGKNTAVSCHFLLQCRKVKSESEVAQSCPTLSDPMDHSPPGSSVHGIFQARVLEWGAIAFSKQTLEESNSTWELIIRTGQPIALLLLSGISQYMLSWVWPWYRCRKVNCERQWDYFKINDSRADSMTIFSGR